MPGGNADANRRPGKHELAHHARQRCIAQSGIDARLPIGDITLAKLLPTMDRLSMTEGQFVGYAQFPGSDCLNGGVLRVRDGRKFMQRLGSHHYLILMGHHGGDLGFVGQVFGLAVEEMC